MKHKPIEIDVPIYRRHVCIFFGWTVDEIFKWGVAHSKKPGRSFSSRLRWRSRTRRSRLAFDIGDLHVLNNHRALYRIPHDTAFPWLRRNGDDQRIFRYPRDTNDVQVHQLSSHAGIGPRLEKHGSDLRFEPEGIAHGATIH